MFQRCINLNNCQIDHEPLSMVILYLGITYISYTCTYIKYCVIITFLGGLWYVLNFFFRTGVHQLSPKTYGDGMKEFTVSFKLIFEKVLSISSLSAIQKCLAAKMFATMNFYHSQWIVFGL